MAWSDIIEKLTKQLYPTGRAWRLWPNGWFDKLNRALAVSEAQAVEDANNLLKGILPNNPDFDADDASIWEERLGLPQSTAALSVRKAAILRKMNHPGTIPARQHWSYIENQLQAAGFDVWVHENLNPNISPIQFGAQAFAGQNNMATLNMGQGNMASPTSLISALIFGSVNMGPFNMGPFNMGGYYTNKVANHIVASEDAGFNWGGSFKSSFFIGGQTAGTFADVDASRELEFRQLILKLKPQNTIAFIFINYTP